MRRKMKGLSVPKVIHTHTQNTLQHSIFITRQRQMNEN